MFNYWAAAPSRRHVLPRPHEGSDYSPIDRRWWVPRRSCLLLPGTSYISQQPSLKSQQQCQLTQRPNCRPQGRDRKSHKPDLPPSDDQLSTQPDLSSIPIARNPTRNSKCATPVAGNSTLQRNQQSPITRIIIQHST